MRQVLVVKSEVLDISANLGGSHPLYGCSLTQTCHTPSFQWPWGQTLKQQFRNGVSEPTVGLVQFSQDIFLLYWIIWPLDMKHVASMATMLTHRLFLLGFVWVKALEASTITLTYKENCSAPTRSVDSSSSISSQSKIETRPFWVDHKPDFLLINTTQGKKKDSSILSYTYLLWNFTKRTNHIIMYS